MYFNQPRIISHVKHATASGTIPTRRFLPSHGSVTNSRRAILLKTPLLKIQPACKPIGSQSERVCNRASARIQPIRNKVLNPAATTLEKAGQLIAPRREKIGDASKIAPQQSKGIAEKTKPVSKSRRQRGFAASCKSFRLQILSDRMSGQSKITAATSSARWKKVSKSY